MKKGKGASVVLGHDRTLHATPERAWLVRSLERSFCKQWGLLPLSKRKTRMGRFRALLEASRASDETKDERLARRVNRKVRNDVKQALEWDNELEELEGQVLEDPTTESLQRIQGFKRELAQIRRMLWPLREALNQLQREDEEEVASALGAGDVTG